MELCIFAESLVKDTEVESEDGEDVRTVGCSEASTNMDDHVMKAATEIMAESTEPSSSLLDNGETEVLEESLAVSTEKHSISVEASQLFFCSVFVVFTFGSLIIYADVNHCLFILSLICC